MGPGTLVDGRFEVIREAGSGGMGVVYEALDRATGARVAVKVLAGGDRENTRRFLRESTVLAQLDHPAIVRYVTHADTSACGPYLVMEWLDGEDLAARLDRGRLSVEESIELVARVADGVGAAHARGLVHRDLKPANVLLEAGAPARAKIIDFGLAREIVVDRALTADGLVVGTVGYLAPEQARSASAVDARADVFALGCILYECLTGRPAFSGGHAVAILAKLLVEPAPRARDLRPDAPRELDALLERMLEKEPARRPADGREVAAALARAGRGTVRPPAPGTVRPPAIGEVEQRVFAVILVGDPSRERERGTTDGATVIALHGPDAHAAILRAVMHYDATCDVAVDGTVVITLAATGSGRDRAVAAARCALALRAACPGAPIGLALGRGQTQGGTAGEVIERAAALLAAARAAGDADAVHADETVASLLDARFVLTPANAGARLHAERNVHEGARLLLGHVTPFVGRGRELGAVVQGFADVAVERASGAFVVIGEAGSGKSRLREEAVRSIRRREPDAVVWFAGGDPRRVESALGLAARVLRDAMGIDEALPPARQRAIVAERVAERGLGDEVERVALFLAELIGCGHEGEHALLAAARRSGAVMRDQTFRAFSDWVASFDAPVLIVVDDLQWADALSVELLGAALRRNEARALMVLALARPEVAEAFPRLWDERGTQTLRLGPLPERAAAQLARDALAGIADDAAVAAIVTRAQGNPFVLEELVRARAAGARELPEGVLALVQARLDATGVAARRVLRAASVFGRVPPPAGVARLLGDELDEAAVRAALDELAERELLEATGADLYAFRHDLVLEAAYATLTEADRALGHRLAGEWLESSGARDAALMAGHFDRGGERERAAVWYARAATAHLDANDLGGARRLAARALELATDEAVRGRAMLALAQVRRWGDDIATAPDLAFEAADRLEPGSTEWLSALQVAASAADTLSRRDVAERAFDRVESVRVAPAAEGARVVLLATIASARLHDGDHEGARALRAIVDVEAEHLAARDPIVLAYVHRGRASRAALAGDSSAERDAWRAAGEAFARGGDRRLVIVARCNAGYGSLALGDYEEAVATLRAALADAEAMDLLHYAAGARHNLGLALALAGQVEAGLREEELAVEGLTRVGDGRLRAIALAYLARIRALAGDLDGAERDARAADEQKTAATTRSIVLATLARVLLARGQLDEALDVAARAAADVEQGLSEGGPSYARLTFAETLWAVGRQAEARAELARAALDLRARAARIDDPAAREVFLRREVTHARILELEAAWGPA